MTPKKPNTQTFTFIPPVNVQAGGKPGLVIENTWTRPGENVLDTIAYELRDCVITEPDGRVVFEMKGLEIPKTWSQLASDILISKYVKRGDVPKTPNGHETGARGVVYRIAHTIRDFGEEQGYFATAQDAENFEQELSFLLINQYAAFNSPVWFNCGLHHVYGMHNTGENWYWDFDQNGIAKTKDAYSKPQCSACFIQKVDDSIKGVTDLVASEARLFKFGSGTGTNFSTIRGANEPVRGGGKASGVMSFLKILDTNAGAIKSGGTTRRAAKMVLLDIDHPEIVNFIQWKQKEERKAKILIEAGFPADFNGEAYATVSGQNSNNSVRLPDSFLEALEDDSNWQTIERVTGKVRDTYKARDLMKMIAEAAWECADPGVQYDTTINKWHTCKVTGRINASNPCSEYMFLDDTACNLSSLNLVKFLDENDQFDIEKYERANRIMFIAQEILVDLSSYPTETIALNSHRFRPLGLGYANLGTLLMLQGIPYDSAEGQAVAGAITAIMTGVGYRTSAEMAAVKGAFDGFAENRESMLQVMQMHRDAVEDIDASRAHPWLIEAARRAWDDTLALGARYGYRNAQATVLAPTGTIGLLMDCDTTGVEPEFSLVKYKKLAGGGFFRMVNTSVARALKNLGYTTEQQNEIIHYISGHNTLQGAPHVSPEQLAKLGFAPEAIAKAEKSAESGQIFDEYMAITQSQLLAAGLTEAQVMEANQYIGGTQMIEGAPHLLPEHLPVFDCANRCGDGERFIAPMGHVRMMAATQPFISGAISKTVNLPNDATVEEIEKIYVESWKLGLKAIALYRDGCKTSQPLSKSKEKKDGSTEDTAQAKPVAGTQAASAAAPAPVLMGIPRGEKVSLPMKRRGYTYGSKVGSQTIYIRTGEYEDGTLGEIFLDMHKEGAAYRSLMNCFAISVSLGLQYGVPLSKYVDKFVFTRFEPSGMTNHPNIKTATSVIDFTFRVLGMDYLGRTDFVHVKPTNMDELKVRTGEAVQQKLIPPAVKQSVAAAKPTMQAATPAKKTLPAVDGATIASVAEITFNEPTAGAPNTHAMNEDLSNMMGDAPLCDVCGHTTVRNGTCYKCLSCGNSMGCS